MDKGDSLISFNLYGIDICMFEDFQDVHDDTIVDLI